MKRATIAHGISALVGAALLIAMAPASFAADRSAWFEVNAPEGEELIGTAVLGAEDRSYPADLIERRGSDLQAGKLTVEYAYSVPTQKASFDVYTVVDQDGLCLHAGIAVNVMASRGMVFFKVAELTEPDPAGHTHVAMFFGSDTYGERWAVSPGDPQWCPFEFFQLAVEGAAL